MSIGDVLIDSRPRIFAGEFVEGQSHKHARVISQAQVDIGHQPFKKIASHILRPGAPVIVVEILKLRAVLKSEREVFCPRVIQRNEFQSVVSIDSQRRIAEKTPVLKPRKRTHWRPNSRLSGIDGRWVWRLCLQHADNKQVKRENSQTPYQSLRGHESSVHAHQEENHSQSPGICKTQNGSINPSRRTQAFTSRGFSRMLSFCGRKCCCIWPPLPDDKVAFAEAQSCSECLCRNSSRPDCDD